MNVVVNLMMAFGDSLAAFITQEAALNRGSVMKDNLSNCKVRLCQAPFVFAGNTTKAAAVEAEADYDGYTAGGNTIAAFGNPLSIPSGGAAITAETTFAYVDDTGHVANTISSGWVERSTGQILMPFNLPTPITLQANGDGFVLQLIDTEGVV